MLQVIQNRWESKTFFRGVLRTPRVSISSMENELENFQRQINAINQVLQNPPPVVQNLEEL